ncbi:MAG: nuclear transport factor 2 family protein [Actinomycetota bacterium]
MVADALAERITAYFASCNDDPPDVIAAHFTDDAVIFDTNHAPIRGAEAIGAFWERIRGQWDGAVWGIDRIISDGESAAIEWYMRGVGTQGPFIFRGSEHYAFEADRIAEIRQYWTFDRDVPDTGLQGYDYGPG